MPLISSLNYDGISYNEEVARKFQLEQNSVIEILTDIRFRPHNLKETNHYYFVVPHKYEQNLVTLEAVSTTTQAELKVKKVDVALKELMKTIEKYNATDINIYQIEILKDQVLQGLFSLTVREVYKRRKEPFPSTVSIKED